MRINADRLHENLRQLARIGATPGGASPGSLCHLRTAARDLLCRWMEEAGLRVRIDDFGNITGRRAGAESGAAVVMASHIDTVRRGGRYDGAYGVLAALEVMRTLNDTGVTTRRPLELVNWTNRRSSLRAGDARLRRRGWPLHPGVRLRADRSRWRYLRR